jgi:hypothetical protein
MAFPQLRRNFIYFDLGRKGQIYFGPSERKFIKSEG